MNLSAMSWYFVFQLYVRGMSDIQKVHRCLSLTRSLRPHTAQVLGSRMSRHCLSSRHLSFGCNICPNMGIIFDTSKSIPDNEFCSGLSVSFKRKAGGRTGTGDSVAGFGRVYYENPVIPPSGSRRRESGMAFSWMIPERYCSS